MPFDALAEGRRGTNAKITAATTASATPTQSRLESTVKSSARMEKREAYRARMVTNGCAMITPSAAPAPQSRRLSANNMRRNAPAACAERRADREFAFAANRPRENQVGNVGAGDDEDQARGSEKDEQNGARARSNLVAEHLGLDAEAGIMRDTLRSGLSPSRRRRCATRCEPGREWRRERAYRRVRSCDGRGP